MKLLRIVCLTLALVLTLVPTVLASGTESGGKITEGTYDYDPTENLAAGYVATAFENKNGVTNWLVTPDYVITVVDVNESGWYTAEDAFIMMPVGASLTLSYTSAESLSGLYIGAFSTTHDAGISAGPEMTPNSATYTFTSTRFHSGFFNFKLQAEAADSTLVTIYELPTTVVIPGRRVAFMNGEEQYAQYDADGSGLISRGDGTSIALPEAPTRDGYTFDGWFTAQGEAFTATTPVVDNDITVYARWIKNEPGTPAEPEEDTVIHVPAVSGPSAAVRPNGTVEAEIPADAAGNAARTGKAVTLPIQPVVNTSDSALAPTITVKTNSSARIPVEIPVAAPTPGTVVVVVNADGTETVIPTSTVSGSGVIADLPDGAVVKVVDNAMRFSDVADGDWFNDAVDFVSARGILTGTGSSRFGESDAASRAMVWTLLARLSGVDTDKGENWYAAAQEWAVASGISDGTDANCEITREQLVTMLWRFVDEPTVSCSLDSFTDGTSVSSWSQAASRWAVGNAVMNGSDGALNPQDITTRGELAQFIMNFISNAI